MSEIENMISTLYRYLRSQAGIGDKREFIRSVIYPQLRQELNEEIDELHQICSTQGKAAINAIHYTKLDILVSMLEAAKHDTPGSFFRLYDSVCVNDPDEGKHLQNVLHLDLRSWLRSDVRHSAYLGSFVSPNAKHERASADNLVFWRTYGDEGQGCSISLRIPSGRLRRVFYGDQYDDFRDTKIKIDRVVKLLDSLKPDELPEPVQWELNSAFWKALRPTCYLYKSKAYSYEKELRVVLVGPPDLDSEDIIFDYRRQPNMPSYVRHYLNEDDLRINKLLNSNSLITIGPCVRYPDNLRHYIKALLKQAKIQGPTVETSKISYQKS